jgi:hypothetical protein
LLFHPDATIILLGGPSLNVGEAWYRQAYEPALIRPEVILYFKSDVHDIAALMMRAVSACESCIIVQLMYDIRGVIGGPTENKAPYKL